MQCLLFPNLKTFCHVMPITNEEPIALLKINLGPSAIRKRVFLFGRPKTKILIYYPHNFYIKFEIMGAWNALNEIVYKIIQHIILIS